MQPLFVFCADLHLEDGSWSTRPGIYGDSYYSFDQIIDYCILHRLPLILGGDILDRKQNLSRPVAKLCAGMSRMQQHDIPVYYIQGNHEYDRNSPWLGVHNWPIHLHMQTVLFGAAVRVYGLDWLPRGDIQAAFKSVPPDTDMLVTHQVWQDLMGNVGRPECALTDVHHAQVVLAGDFHVTKIITGVNAQNHSVELVSPGSTTMQDISEDPQKFFFVVSAVGDGTYNFLPQPLITRNFLSYKVQTAEELDTLCAGKLAEDIAAATAAAREQNAAEDIQKPLVRVKFNKELPDAYVRLTAAVGASAHLFCDAITEKTRDAQKQTNRATTKNDLLHTLAEILGSDTDAYKFAQTILHAPNPKRAVEAHFQSCVKGTTHAIVETGSAELGAPSEEVV